MENNEVITKQENQLAMVFLLGLIAGVLIYLAIENEKGKEKTKQIPEEDLPDLRIEFHQFLQDSDPDNLDDNIDKFIDDHNEVFTGKIVTIVKKEVRQEVRVILQSLIEDGAPITQERIAEVLGDELSNSTNKEHINGQEIVSPISNNGLAIRDKEITIIVATKEEMMRKIYSKYGKESLHIDLKLLHSKNHKGDFHMEEDEVNEFISNISGYSEAKPTGKKFTPKIRYKKTLYAFMYQLCKKHKEVHDTDEKFANILTNNFTQFSSLSAKKITSSWSQSTRDKSNKKLQRDPHIIFINP